MICFIILKLFIYNFDSRRKALIKDRYLNNGRYNISVRASIGFYLSISNSFILLANIYPFFKDTELSPRS